MGLYDVTPDTPEEADALLAELAHQDARLRAADALTDRMISDLKAKSSEDTAPIRKRIADITARLTEYIESHKDRFDKLRKTPCGSYGLRVVSSVLIEDPDKLIEWARINAPALCSLKLSPDKGAIAKAIGEGRSVPFARSETERRPVIKIATVTP